MPPPPTSARVLARWQGAQRLEVGVIVTAAVGEAENVVHDGRWSSTRDTAVLVALEDALALLVTAVTTTLGTLVVALAVVAALAGHTTRAARN